MKLSEQVRKMLVEAGMPETANDAEARAFAEANGIKLVDASGKTPESDLNRSLELLAIGQKYGLYNEVADALRAGKTSDEILTMILESREAKPVGIAEIGLSKKEKKQFSFLRAINALANGKPELAPFEREVSDAAARHMGIKPQGMLVPMDILGYDAAREITVVDTQISTTKPTGAAGGNLVATELLSGSFIELLMARLVLSRLGITYLTGLRGNIAIPKQTGGSTAYFLPENGQVDLSDLKFTQLAMAPKTIGAAVDFSRLITMQSSLSIEQLVRSDIAAHLAQKIEEAAISGTGSDNQPKGLLNYANVKTVALGTNGDKLDWDAVVQMETEVFDQNVYDNGTMAYLFNSRTRGTLKTTEKFAGSGREIFASGGDGFGEVNGYRAAMSNLLPKNGTKGTGTNLSTAVFGRWSDLFVGLWGVLDLMVDPYSASLTGAVRVVGFQTFDTLLRYEESFSKCTDIVTN